VWTSFFGWCSLVLAAFAFGAALMAYLNRPDNPPVPAAAAALALLLSVPCILLWAVGPIVHRFRVETERTRAEAMV
jgi:hypothetical protein